MSVAYTYLGIYKFSPLTLTFQKVIGSLKVFLLVFTLVSLVTACSSLPLKLLTGGGPYVAANTQVAKTATQTVGKTVATGDQKIDKIEGHAVRVEQVQSQDNKIKTESVEQVTINETPPWVILLLILGWLLPTPQDIGNRIYLWLSHLVSKLKWRN